ncbi:MAG: adenylosuccinate synthetase [Thaumarchaeota archaeon]|nr:adenylosuccinate synthetase [Nitrososphaerota archaeon]RNJ72542.1 MAG: adenylosuccinate synthetase [Thaumarchaeota archaeon S14]RNJ74207.1 MAG: adenylosuccinate synthetase [Thaumarchaeota archaeon S13]MDD9809391.1 adenylosuccinate synthetase [Nitrososphaerota archaeon]MDD9812739.1 adenylosuccinate synthetase [Nitrososphaerota archaeon]
MPSTVVVGGFYGDEGKGKLVSYLATRDSPRLVARGGAGPNAGHTIVDGGRTHKVRMVPCGFVSREARLAIGPGVLVDPDVLLREARDLGASGRLVVDSRCGVITAAHREADSRGDLAGRIGSTGSGTGPANADRAMRTLGLAADEPSLKGMVGDVPLEVNSALDAGERVLVEGTQGTFLSLWHGTYPYVTSKDVTAAGICADVGLAPRRVDEVIVAFKAYVTRVGSGPLEGELAPAEAEARGWAEFGAVTGRPRRAAAFDHALARRAAMLNGATQAAITKLDVAFGGCEGARSWSDLTAEARSFVEGVEASLGVRVTLMGTGPRVEDVVDRRAHA